MSRGKQVVTFRCPDPVLNAMAEAIEQRNGNVRKKPWTQTEFILIAIAEKVAKMERGRVKPRTFEKAKERAAAQEAPPSK